MLQIFLIILAMFPGTFCASWFTTRLVPFERPLLYTYGVTVVLTVIWYINNYVLPSLSAALDIFMYAVWFLLLYLLGPRKQYLRALFVQILLLVAQLFADFTTALLAVSAAQYFQFPVGRLLNMSSRLYPLMCLLCAATSCLFMYFCVWIIRRFIPLEKMGGTRADLIWTFSIPLSQLILVNIAIRLSFQPHSVSGVSLVVILGILFASAADIACILGYQRYRKLQETAFHLRQIQQQMDNQTAYFEEMQKHILAINQVRHDLNNQLQTAYCLLDRGQFEEVRQQLDVLQNSIVCKVGTTYCENMIVDAVLCQKAEECRKNHIPFRISTLVPAKIGIKNSHLCSIFSNLLDNSIQGILKTDSRQEELRLQSDIRRGYLVICCSNPAAQPQGKMSRLPWREHGLGLDILRHLAQLYQGCMDADFAEGRFTVTLTLKIDG